jgi:hypothetical protein
VEQVGSPEDLPELERLMNESPAWGDLHYRHEQAYFAAPEAWARIVVRSGLFAAYARPSMGADGAPVPSTLQKMLTSKDKPLLVAAALRAMALARDPSFREKPVDPAGDAPAIHPGRRTDLAGNAGPSSTPAYPFGYREDHILRRFGPHHRLPPAF